MDVKPGKIKSKAILVKLHIDEGKGSYYVNIPQEVRDFLDIKGGEYFTMKGEIKGEKKQIKLKLTEFAEE